MTPVRPEPLGHGPQKVPTEKPSCWGIVASGSWEKGHTAVTSTHRVWVEQCGTPDPVTGGDEAP